MHIHTHQHGHSDQRSLAIAAGITGAIFVAEVVGGLLSRSLALLSDAGHMLTDLLALIIALIGATFANRPATAVPERFTYGYRRLETITALVNALTLFGMCIFILYEAVRRLLETPQPVALPVMMGVAAIGLIANLLSAQFLRHSQSLNVRSAYLHVLMDLLSSVAVILGGGIMWLTQAYWIDPLLSMLIVLLILRSAFPILRRSLSILLDAAPPYLDIAAVRAAMEKVEGVRGVHDVHIWQLDTDTPMLSAHVVVAPRADRDQVLKELQQLLRERFHIAHSTLQTETEKYVRMIACERCRIYSAPSRDRTRQRARRRSSK